MDDSILFYGKTNSKRSIWILIMAKLKTYDVTIFNMNLGLGKDRQPKETEVVRVKGKNQDEAERFAISGGLSGWGVWDSVEVKD